ncbi:glycosyltransferase family 4 protein [candidate division KSB1 bacterium]|nr:glycosyltransferase family 4 protein [candidate division KSB1 bacterium]RQW10472.1 MAG: glycosyltransferase family 1 protein [candidate division KSB1 bacterium]
MNMIYLSNERFPATLACTIQQMRMCEAFAKAGARVQLVRPVFYDMPSYSVPEICEFYDVAPCFEMKRLFSLLSLSKPAADGVRHVKIPLVGGLSLLISTWAFALTLLKRGILNRPLAVYSRNVISAFVFLKFKHGARRKDVKIVFEVHSLDQQQPKRFFHKILRESDALICITKALRDAIIKKFDVPKEKILVAEDGVSHNLVHQPVPSKEEARRTLGIKAQQLVLYTGQLFPGKGADVFVEAARSFDKETQFMLVGGQEQSVKQLQKRVAAQNISNVRLIGFVPPARVPLYQAAADLLVLPASANHAISAYTSPLKLFEYMAARRPIVASDLPVLREVLQDGLNALLFEERSASDLAQKIRLLLNDSGLQEKLAQRAWQRVQSFTWEERARRILAFIQNGTMI